MHGLVGKGSGVDALAVAGLDEDDLEGSFGEHAGEGALARGDGEGFLFVVPMNGDGGIDAFFVVIGIAFVFVECEIGVGAGVDAEFNWVGGFFGGVLEFGTHGQNGTGADVERNAVQGGGCVYI